MAVTSFDAGIIDSPRPRFWNNPTYRKYFYQVVLIVLLAALAWTIVTNVAINLKKQNIASGFGFLDRLAGFDISQTLISYSNQSSYGRVFWIGLLNTVLVAGIGIVCATIVGFVVGIARLSPNWLIRQLAGAYVETLRNIPLLLQLFVWYFGILQTLPSARQSITIPGGGFLNVRGLFLPQPVPGAGFWIVGTTVLLGVIAAVVMRGWARRRQLLTGQPFPVFWAALGLIVIPPLLVFLALGLPLSFDYPALKGFNFSGGMVILPEFMALLLGLVFYTASYIAEIVRSGILGVAKGQTEAARSLGLSSGQNLSLVVVPQAMRIVIPPLTNQFLNLTKNSSLAVAIGYPDLVSVFTGTVLNQTGQAVEIVLMTMGVFLTLSLATSALMNWFNNRVRLVER